ncbi:MAG: DegT/DnrJ/EryC1/StrS family aminotransferase [Candidatus Dormibacteraeota bacterium]|nr:DegT/DnrJ/EryC1/StrS family aminotransferase [Candidatus Dormibacteraeota bacterium]
MTEDRIPVFKPYIGVDTSKAAVDALDLGWLGMGSYVRDFENGLRARLETERQVVAVNTGTSALHLAMLILGIGPGDEVITPSFNNIGDFQAIRAVGADPVFCDIQDDSLGIDVDKAEALISPRTKAVIGMDYAGVPCALADLEAMARRHGIKMIHDAAHSLGSRAGGRQMGEFGDITIFSFDPVKIMTTIDGGALVVRSATEVEKLQQLRLLGMDQSATRMYTNNRAWTYDVAGPGYRYHLANLHASIGLSQLARLDEFIETRRDACRTYTRRLAGTPGLILPATSFEDVAPFIYYVRVTNGRRDELIASLRDAGVDTGIHWIPGHNFSFLKACRHGDLSVTNRVGAEILTLPLHSYMTASTIGRVADGLQASLAERRAA